MTLTVWPLVSLITASHGSAATTTTVPVTVPADLSIAPDPQGLPGWQVLQVLTNGLDGWALLAAMAGIVIGAVMWAFGHYSHNFQQAYNGRRGVLVSALAAVLIGGAAPIVGFLMQKGGMIH